MISAEAVDAVATTLYPGWETSPSDWRDYFRRKATEALEAAAPHMLAKAWDEGAEAAWERSTPEVNGERYMWRSEGDPINPHRLEQA